MRLINAEALKEVIEKIELSMTNKKTIINLIDNAPTVDKTDVISYIDCFIDGAEAVRPHGKWIDIYPLTYECSICRGDALDVNEYPYQSNFCPHCGADMRESNTNGVDNI